MKVSRHQRLTAIRDWLQQSGVDCGDKDWRNSGSDGNEGLSTAREWRKSGADVSYRDWWPWGLTAVRGWRHQRLTQNWRAHASSPGTSSPPQSTASSTYRQKLHRHLYIMEKELSLFVISNREHSWYYQKRIKNNNGIVLFINQNKGPFFKFS